MTQENENYILDLRKQGFSIREIANKTDYSKSSVGKIIKQNNTEKEPKPISDDFLFTTALQLAQQMEQKGVKKIEYKLDKHSISFFNGSKSCRIIIKKL